ncbi:MAG: CsbD family protein [candidate division Zixibacteria bacterium]|nr:CsbD family protein [candidate division Zixibacteria bacterium]
MDWYDIEDEFSSERTQWKSGKGKVRKMRDTFTEDRDMYVVASKHDRLVGKVQEKYGLGKIEAQKRVLQFLRNYR